MKSGIYKISFIGSNRIYIGSAVNFKKRWDLHLYNFRNNTHNPKIQNAFNKYGEDNLRFEIIEECEANCLIKLEQHYLDTLLFAKEYLISKDNRFDKLGFNICSVAGSALGVKHSAETNRNKSERQKGKKIKPCSEATKVLLSKLNKGKKLSKGTIDKIRETSTGRLHSVDTKQLLSSITQGNRRGNKITYVKNIETGEVNQYESKKIAANKTGCIETEVSKKIKSGKTYKGFIFSYTEIAA